MKLPQTIKELRLSCYQPRSVKQEMRKNLVVMIERGETLFPGIVGYLLAWIIVPLAPQPASAPAAVQATQAPPHS